MDITKIRLIGNSIGTTIPSDYVKYCNIEKGDIILWYLNDEKELQIKLLKSDIKE